MLPRPSAFNISLHCSHQMIITVPVTLSMATFTQPLPPLSASTATRHRTSLSRSHLHLRRTYAIASALQETHKDTPTALHKTTSLHHSYSDLISAAVSLRHLKQIHAHMLKLHLHHNHLLPLLLSSISFSSSTSYALNVISSLDYIPPPNISNQILKRVSRSIHSDYTLNFFQRMRNNGFPIDRFTFPTLLKVASKCGVHSEGKLIHGLASKLGFHTDPFVETALVGFYASCGQISEARLVFDKMPYRDVVTWNIMIDGYCQIGLLDDVFKLVEEMKNSNIEPDERVFTTILSACARLRNLEAGKLVHKFITEDDIVGNSYMQSALIGMYSSCGAMDVAQSLYDTFAEKNLVVSTAMVTGYSRIGNIEAARAIFDQMVKKDLICWSAMISGYAESDKPQEALKIFVEMKKSGIKPDQVTILSVISACAHLGALDNAKQIHKFVDENGFGKALPVNNALIDMYAKCGNLEGAKEVFGRMYWKNVISWTSMINAYAIHGDVDNSLNHFELMKHENVKPNWITFVGVLYACSHAGLVEHGQKIFASMVDEYGIKPKLEHYGCMVDLYSRANRLRDALELAERMPLAPNVIIWGSIMAACRRYNELELGEFAAKRVLELDPDHDGAHVFISNIYATQQRWENVGEVRKFMKHQGILKERGWSKIEMDNEVHEFLTGDRAHKHADEIYAKLNEVVDKLKDEGYVPDTRCVLVDLDEDEKKDAILWHSEKLAFCYGLIRGEKGSCIRIIKNLRICEDCHNFMKMASKVFDRKIVVRDRTRFHHCVDGLCSCKDYW